MQAFGIELESNFWLLVFPVAQVKLTDDQNWAPRREVLYCLTGQWSRIWQEWSNHLSSVFPLVQAWSMVAKDNGQLCTVFFILFLMVLMQESISNAVLKTLHPFQAPIQTFSTKDWKKYIQIIWCLLQIEVMLTLKCIAGHCDVCTSNETWIGRAENTQHSPQFQIKFIFPNTVSHEQNIPKHNYSS